MLDHFNIQSLVRERVEQASFHVAAETHVRIEYRNFTEGQTLGPFTYDGDIVVTCYRGRFAIQTGTSSADFSEFDQGVVPAETEFGVACTVAGTLQLIWSPPHAATARKV